MAGHLKRLSKIKFSKEKKKFPTWAIITISLGVASLLSLSIYSIVKNKNNNYGN